MCFDAENGYALAASYEMGKVVDSYGGGICQVSTTLYVAVLKAELEVTERYSHSMIVHYVDPSMDAAIAEGLKDLKFINNTDAPIYIEASADGSTLHFAIYGHETRDPNRTVRYESETTSTEDPTPGLTEDANASFGTIEQTSYGYQGSTARLWKIVNDNGNETKEQVNSSTYRMTSDVYTVGTKTDNAAARAEMQAAIAANDLAKAKEVAAKYSQSSSSSSSSEKKEDSSDDSDSDGTEKTDDSSDTEKTEDDED
ncbi:MAG: VanW family protein [Fusicatenibacter saccharivorans]